MLLVLCFDHVYSLSSSSQIHPPFLTSPMLCPPHLPPQKKSRPICASQIFLDCGHPLKFGQFVKGYTLWEKFLFPSQQLIISIRSMPEAGVCLTALFIVGFGVTWAYTGFAVFNLWVTCVTVMLCSAVFWKGL